MKTKVKEIIKKKILFRITAKGICRQTPARRGKTASNVFRYPPLLPIRIHYSRTDFVILLRYAAVFQSNHQKVRTFAAKHGTSGIEVSTFGVEVGTIDPEVGTFRVEVPTSALEVGATMREARTSSSEVPTSTLEVPTFGVEVPTFRGEVPTYGEEGAASKSTAKTPAAE